MSRYARQMMLPEIGTEGQARLSAARVLVVGAGGLAAPVLPLLAGAGIGQLTLIDADRVDLSNLHRQTLFSEGDCGKSKVDVAAQRCRCLNTNIVVEAKKQALTPANTPDLVAETDLVLDCADNYAASYTLSDTCLELGKPLISASVLGRSGYVGGFCGGAPSLRAVFPDAPDNGASCASSGVLGPVVAMIGAMQAQMALLVALGLEPSPLGQVVQVDGLSMRSTGFRFDTAPEPTQRFSFAAPAQLTLADMIVDLRSATEAPDLIHPNAYRIAMDDVADNLPPTGTRLALCCATGLRAWRMAERIQPGWAGEIVLVAAASS